MKAPKIEMNNFEIYTMNDGKDVWTIEVDFDGWEESADISVPYEKMKEIVDYITQQRLSIK